ncbi:MAG: N,N'-diacetyllegionaminate synthase [Verrucomicrobiales bacterium]|jgi:N,N'-diacetyllegionaminate synthase
MSEICLIAEIGQAHDGSLGICHSYIDALEESGIDAVKFQTHIAAAESSELEPFRVKFSQQDETRMDYWKRMEFSRDQWQGLKDHCDKVGLEFLSSPFSLAAIDLLESIDIGRYKIGSGEVTNLLMLEKIGMTGKPVILSSGMSSFHELDDAVTLLKGFGSDVSILQCTTAYPTQPEDIGLNVISEFAARYQTEKVGLSDHSGTIFPSLAAVVLGAKVIEVHCVFDRDMFGPDSKASLTIAEITDLAKGVRFLEQSLAVTVDKADNSRFQELKGIFEKSLAVNKRLPEGHVITFDDLESKKPAGCGIPAREHKMVIGATLQRGLEQYAFLEEDNIDRS